MLHEQERQLSALINNLPGAVFRVRNDPNYTVEYVSDQIAELTGYPADDFREHRRHFSDLMHPDDREWVWNEIQKALKERRPYEVTYRFIDAHGKEKWNWERGTGIFDANGKLQAVEGFVQDITERMRVEEELRKSEEKFSFIFKNAPYAASLVDISTRTIVDVNRAHEKLFEHSREDFVGKSPEMLLMTFDSKQRERIGALIREQGFVDDEELTVSLPSGKRIVFLLSASTISVGGKNYLLTITKDITALKQAVEVLAERAQRFRAVIENAWDVVLLVSPEGAVTYASPSIERVLGYSTAEVTGRNGFDLVHPEDLAIAHAMTEKGLAHPGQAFTFELRMLHKNGDWRTMEISAASYLHNTAVGAIVANMRDITKRKRAEETVKESEARWQSYVSNAPNVIFTVDREYKITFMNYTLPGYSLEDILGVSMFDFLPEESREIAKQALDKVFDTGERQVYEVLGPGVHGNPAWYSTSVGPIKKDGNVVSAILVATDITERKRAEEKLHESEVRFRSLITNSADGIVLFKEHGVISFVSPSTEKILGYSSDESVSRSVFEFIHPNDQVSVKRKLLELLRHPETPVQIEVRLRHKNGSWRYLEGTLTNLFHVPSVKAIVNNFRDITERKRAEESLRKAFRQLTTTEERLRRMAAQELHDEVGQNLTALSINLHHLLTQLPPEYKTKAEPRLRDSLSLLEDTIQRTRDIMTELRPSVLEEYGVNAALRWYVQRFCERSNISGQYSGKELSKRLPTDVEYAMFRVVQECFNNIAKHSKARNVICTLEETTTDVRCTIQDDGVGFAVEKIAHDKPEEHFGLLSMKERIAGIGGTFTIKSKPNKGTTVIIEIRK